MAQKVPFQTILAALRDESKPFPASYLNNFSDLAPADLDAFLQAWGSVPDRRRHTFLEDLEDLAVTDTLTNFDDLAKVLLEDPDPYVRIEAMHLLWESEDKKLIPIYLKFLREDQDMDVRAAAASALGSFIYLGELEKIPADFHHVIEDELLKLVDSGDDPVVRRRALESLGYSGREEVAPLIEAAYADPDPEWVSSSLFAMGRSSDDRWKKQVLSQLRAPDEEIRAEAIQAAGELELGAARTSLLDQLDDEEDPDIRRNIIWSLSKIGGEGVRDKLDELLETEMDEEEGEFIEEAIDNLSFTEDAAFQLLDLGLGDESLELDEEDDFDEDHDDPEA